MSSKISAVGGYFSRTPYYRWTGFIAGKRTTKTISKQQAEECERRIKNYRALLRKLDQIAEEALVNAPWNQSP